MDDMDLRALANSEIFKEYASNELKKNAINEKSPEEIEFNELKALNDFEEFQKNVNSSKKKKEIFKNLQILFQTNEKYASTIDKGFVDVVLLLDIE